MNHKLLVLVLSAFLATPLAAQVAAPARTYIIVHGAWGGGWDWKTVDSLLTAQGHKVYRPSLTGLGERYHVAGPNVGLDTHIDDVVNLIRFESLHDVVLIGHSYGGMVITGAADRIGERIQHMIYVDALVPDSGETALGLLGADFERRVRANVRDGVVHAIWEAKDRPPPRDTPHPFKTLTDPLPLNPARVARVPATYILTFQPGREPDDFEPFAQRAAKRGWQVFRMQADHVPERSAPKELVELIGKAQ